MTGTITLNQLTVKRSVDGLTIVGRDNDGREHKFTAVYELVMLSGEVTLTRSGGMVSIAPSKLES